MKRLIAMTLVLSACVAQEPEMGVIMPGPSATSWGMPDAAILASDTVLHGADSSTVTIQFFGAQVSDDEMGAAPALICSDLQPNILSSTVRSPTADEALGDGTLMMIVTCGA